MKSRILLLIGLSLVVASTYFSPTDYGVSPYAFGTAGRFPVLPDGANSVFYNPALLLGLNDQISAFYSNIHTDTDQLNIALTHNKDPFPIGAGVSRFSVNNLISTYVDGDGVVQKGNTFAYANNVYVLGTAMDLRLFTIGANIKIFQNDSQTNKAFGMNSNVGIKYALNNDVVLTLVGENIVPTSIAWQSGNTESPARNVILGGWGSFGPFSFSSSQVFYNLEEYLWSYSLSYSMDSFFPFIAYTYDTLYSDNPFVKVGARLQVFGLTFDYALIPNHLFDKEMNHYFALKLELGSKADSQNSPAKKPKLRVGKKADYSKVKNEQKILIIDSIDELKGR